MSFTIQEVVLQAVENPKSYFLGNAITELLRYREGEGSPHLTAARQYIELLEKLEKPTAPEVAVPLEK